MSRLAKSSAKEPLDAGAGVELFDVEVMILMAGVEEDTGSLGVGE